MRRSSASLLRRSIPLLLAVTALLGPGSAEAAGPAPDPSASTAPKPDPAPVAAPRPAVRVTAVQPTARATGQATPAARAVAAAPRRAAAPVAAPVVAKHRPAGPAHATRPAARLVERRVPDVPPFRVDIHRGLGAVTRSLHDDSLLLLAGIALLVATSTAASGATLALVAARSGRRS